MARTKEIPNSVSISTRSSEKQRKTLSLLNCPDKTVRDAERLLLSTKSALKIITVAFISDNSDFFASMENYNTLSAIFGEYGIDVSKDIVGAEAYSKKPTTAWTELIILLFSILLGFGDRGGVHTVVASESYSEREHGVIMELSVDTEDIDDKFHTLSVVANGDSGGKYIAVDGEGILY